MCYHKRESIGDYRLDEPDCDRFETEPDPDAPRDDVARVNELLDEMYIIATGKTRKEWEHK